MSTVETTDEVTRSSRDSLTRESSQDAAARTSGRSAVTSYLLQFIALISVMATPFTALGSAVLNRIQAAKTVGETVRRTDNLSQPVVTRAAFVNAIRRLAGAALGFVVVILLMIQLWQMDMVTSANGPWADLLTQIKTVLMASFGLIGLALFAYAANIAMSALNFGGGGGGR